MVDFVPFKAEHLRYLRPQQQQENELAALVQSNLVFELERGFALSAFHNSKCVACAGVMSVYSHRAIAWAFMGRDAGAHMLAITRRIKAAFRIIPYTRVEMYVNAEFEAGQRFAEVIGMYRETPEPMRKHGALGEDEYQYVMVK